MFLGGTLGGMNVSEDLRVAYALRLCKVCSPLFRQRLAVLWRDYEAACVMSCGPIPARSEHWRRKALSLQHRLRDVLRMDGVGEPIQVQADEQRTFGRVLRRLRMADPRQLNLADVADAIGTTIAYVSEMERGLRLPAGPRMVDDIADFLRLDPAQRNLLRLLAFDCEGV